ncbi:MAG: hypothetical protein AB1668_04230 [Nanoarchaeota archaeon]
MSSLMDRLTVPLLGLAAVVSGCSIEAVPFLEEVPRTEPMDITEPGTYKVIPGDVIKGPLGVDLRVEEVIPGDKLNGGKIVGGYINSEGEKEFEKVFASSTYPIAFYRIRVLDGEEPGTLTVTADPEDLYDKCIEFKNKGHKVVPIEKCNMSSPTEALGGEVLVESSSGYFGKVNDPLYSNLAVCGALDIEEGSKKVSEFLGVSPLSKGAAQLYIFSQEKPESTGITIGNVSIWFYKDDDFEAIKSEITYCEEKIETNKFSANHELVHQFVNKYQQFIPTFFQEGLANFVPAEIKGEAPQWATPESMCQKEGLNLDGTMVPYSKYNQAKGTISSGSGECFYVKLTNNYGDGVMRSLFDCFQSYKKNGKNPEKEETTEEMRKDIFEKALQSIGVNLNNFKEWGLGE